MDVNCPRCGQPLTKVFYRGKIAFRCPQGHGEAVSLSVVRALCGEPTFANVLWRKALDASGQDGGPCPLCHLPMSVIRLPVNGLELELDICCRCQELWFDPTELESLPEPPPPPEVRQMPQRAQEILALHAVNEMNRNPGPPSPETLEWGAVLMGLPVKSNAPACSGRPWCTWSLTALCMAFFLLTADHTKVAAHEWGMIPAECFRERGITFFSSMFLHANILHLVGNMYFLLVFGGNVEDVLGAPTYLALVLGSQISANLLHIICFHNSVIPCIGASGFISGLIAAYAVFFPKATISFIHYFHWINLPASCAFLFWLVYQGLMALMKSPSSGGVGYVAHVGGALFGLVVGFLLRHRLKHCADEMEEL